MSIKISSLAECPHCKTDLTPDPRYEASKVFENCPGCGRKLGNPKCKYLQLPNYFHIQVNNLKKDLVTEVEDKVRKGSNYKSVKEDESTKRFFISKYEEIEADILLWSRECSTEHKLAPLYDSLVILENLLFTKTPASDIQLIVTMAKKIGSLATSIDQYFKAGGRLYDREVRQPRTDFGEDSWDEATATARRDI